MPRYILVPPKGLFGSEEFAKLIANLTTTLKIKVIHRIRDYGPTLVEMDESTAGKVAKVKGVRILPLVKYRLYKGGKGARNPLPLPQVDPPVTTSQTKVIVSVGGTAAPVGGAIVAAFTDFQNREGVWTTTDDAGEALLDVKVNKIKRIICDPGLGYWGVLHEKPLISPVKLRVRAVDNNLDDCVRHYYGDCSGFDNKVGITVGVIDSGVGPHKNLKVVGGKNLVLGQPEADFQDVSFHGTHVAGLIGSTGDDYPKLPGIAPGVKLRSYRVLNQNLGGDNYSICRAITCAAGMNDPGETYCDEKCDILNLSIEDARYDVLLQESITFAREKGMVVVASAGNDFHGPVNYPAAYPGVVAVSAMGCETTFPPGSLERLYIERPPFGGGNFSKEFLAAFTDIGPQIAVTAPGVGILSILPYDPYCSPLSGTSMATPVVAGAIANLLSQNPDIYNMPRKLQRAKAIENLLLQNCIPLGFGPEYEGCGMPDPSKLRAQ